MYPNLTPGFWDEKVKASLGNGRGDNDDRSSSRESTSDSPTMPGQMVEIKRNMTKTHVLHPTSIITSLILRMDHRDTAPMSIHHFWRIGTGWSRLS